MHLVFLKRHQKPTDMYYDGNKLKCILIHKIQMQQILHLHQ